MVIINIETIQLEQKITLSTYKIKKKSINKPYIYHLIY